jgi:hypothetical protein
MPSPQLVTELIQHQDKTITLLETHGELHGEIKDTLRLLPLKELLESAVSNKYQFIHKPIEIKYHIY